MPFWAGLDHVSQTFCQVLHSDRTEHIVPCTFNLSIASYVVWEVGQNKVPHYIEVLSDAKHMLPYQIAELQDIAGAHKSHVFDERLTASVPSCLEAKKGRRNHIPDIFFFHIVRAWSSSSFQLEIQIVPYLLRRLKTYLVFSSDLLHLVPILGSTRPAADTSTDSFLYKNVNANCEFGLITTFLTLSISVAIICGGCNRTPSRALLAESERVANNGGQWPLLIRNMSSSGH